MTYYTAINTRPDDWATEWSGQWDRPSAKAAAKEAAERYILSRASAPNSVRVYVRGADGEVSVFRIFVSMQAREVGE